MEERTVKIYSDLSISKTSFLKSDNYFAQHESKIFSDRREIEQSDKKRFFCPYCNQHLSIRGGVGKDKRILHFVHPSNDIDCIQKTSLDFLSKSSILQKKFKECNESPLHKLLKDFIAKRLLENQKDFSEVEVEKREYHESKISGYHIPDVKAKYKENRVAFELQLSTTFLHEIVKREVFYRNKREMYLIWIFSILKEDISDEDLLESNLFKAFTTKDIFYSNYWNLFVIDQKAMLLSLEKNDLILKCFYKVEDDFYSEYVSFLDLIFEKETKIIYYRKPIEKPDEVKKPNREIDDFSQNSVKQSDKISINATRKTIIRHSKPIDRIQNLMNTISVGNLSTIGFVENLIRELQVEGSERLRLFGLEITEQYFNHNKTKNKLPITHFFNAFPLNKDSKSYYYNFYIHYLTTFLIDNKIFLLNERINERFTPLEALLAENVNASYSIDRFVITLITFNYQLKGNITNRKNKDLEIIDSYLASENLSQSDGYLFEALIILKYAYINQLQKDEALLLHEHIQTLKALESIKQGKVIGYNFPNIIQVLHNAMNIRKGCKLIIKEVYEANKTRLGLKESKLINSSKIDINEKNTPIYKLLKKIYPSIFS